MKLWLVKHKGKTWWGNVLNEAEVTFSNGEKAYMKYCFYRRKDAVLFMQSREYPEFYEVVSAEIQNSKQDNRKNK